MRSRGARIHAAIAIAQGLALLCWIGDALIRPRMLPGFNPGEFARSALAAILLVGLNDRHYAWGTARKKRVRIDAKRPGQPQLRPLGRR